MIMKKWHSLTLAVVVLSLAVLNMAKANMRVFGSIENMNSRTREVVGDVSFGEKNVEVQKKEELLEMVQGFASRILMLESSQVESRQHFFRLKADISRRIISNFLKNEL